MLPANRLIPQALITCIVAGCGYVPGLPRMEKIPFVHRIDIEQGNIITQEMLAQLQPGMEKSKVRYIMGSPLIVDTFHTNRWDYVYSLQEGGGVRTQRRVSLYFEDEKLARVEGNVRPAAGPMEVQRERAAMVEVPGTFEPSIVERLKSKVGLGDDLPETKPAAEGAKAAAGSDEAGPASAPAATDEAGQASAQATTDETGQASTQAATDAAAPTATDEESVGQVPENEEPQAGAVNTERVAKQTIVVPKDAPTSKPDKRGFFRRMWDKMGGEKDQPAAGTAGRPAPDPSDPDTGGEL